MQIDTFNIRHSQRNALLYSHLFFTAGEHCHFASSANRENRVLIDPFQINYVSPLINFQRF